MTACSTCNASFSCERLATALKIIAAMPDLSEHPPLQQLYDNVRARLERAGWRQPDRASVCALATQDEEIRHLTDELIAAVSQERTVWSRASALAASSDDDA